MNDKLGRGALAANGTVTYNYTSGDINYIGIHKANDSVVDDDVKVTINFRSGEVNHVLVNRLELQELAEIQAIERGLDYKADEEQWVAVSVGKIHAGEGSNVEITVENTDGTNATAIGVYAIDSEEDVDHFIQYEKTSVLAQSFNDVIRIYSDGMANSDTVTVKCENESFHTDGVGADLEALALFGIHDAGATDPTVNIIFDSKNGIPTDDVHVNMSGSGSLIAKRQLVYQPRLSRYTKAAVQKSAAKAAKMEDSDPQKARAFRHAGWAAKSFNLFNIHSKMKG